MGTGITDATGRIASSGAGIPAFVGVLRQVGPVRSSASTPMSAPPGDVFITQRSVARRGSRISTIWYWWMPVFSAGRLIAWTANIAHNSDVGGMAPGFALGGGPTEIFQEGLRLPCRAPDPREGALDDAGDGDHHRQQPGCPTFPQGRRLGGHRLGRRVGAAPAGGGWLRNTAPTPSSRRWRASWPSARRPRWPNFAQLPKGDLHPVRGPGRRAGVQRLRPPSPTPEFRGGLAGQSRPGHRSHEYQPGRHADLPRRWCSSP